MLQQPVRVGSLALGCALATSALVLVTFLASNLLLTVLGGVGQVAAEPAAQRSDEPPAAAVLLSTAREKEKACERRSRDVGQQRIRDSERCAEQRRNGDRLRP